MKKWEERQATLLSELRKKQKLSAEEVKKLLGVSESTVRRTIIELEKERKLIRCFGGIQEIVTTGAEYSYSETEVYHKEEKEAIGRQAAALVESGDVIYMSGGSTLKYMAMALKERLLAGELYNVSVVTNSLVSSELLADQINVIMPGGIYRKKFQDLAGSMTEKGLRTMWFSKAFLGVVAISEKEGLMTSDVETNSVMEVVLSKTDQFYILADSSKMGKNSFTSFGNAKDAKGIITDQNLDKQLENSFVSDGVTIITTIK